MANAAELCDMKSENHADVHEIHIKSEPGGNTVDDVGCGIKSAADECAIDRKFNTYSETEEAQPNKFRTEECGEESIQIKFETENDGLSGECSRTMPGTEEHNLDETFQMISKERENNKTCQTCQKSFASRNALVKHMKAHYERFPCEVCGKTFNRKGILKRHYKMHEQKKIACHVCGNEFASMD